jgi:hypothetical protein
MKCQTVNYIKSRGLSPIRRISYDNNTDINRIVRHLCNHQGHLQRKEQINEYHADNALDIALAGCDNCRALSKLYI